MNSPLTDEEIIKKQERLYALESSAMAGPPMSEAEKVSRIKAFLDDDYLDKLYAKFGIDKNEQPKTPHH